MFILLLLISFIGFNSETCVCKEYLEKLVSKNPYIFEAEIIEIYDSSGVWSESAIFNYQQVKYKIHRTFKGENDFDEIVVSHALIEGSRLADKEKPQLSPTHFYKGRKLILFVEQINPKNKYPGIKENEFIVTDSECNVLPSDKELVERLEKLLEK